MLGSTEEGAKIAAHFGLPFSYAHFINPFDLERACDVYRRDFEPSEFCEEPTISLGVFILCTDSREEAEDLALCRDLWRIRVERGEFEPFPSVDEAKSYALSSAEQERVKDRREHQILGEKEPVREMLDNLTEIAGASELSIVSITHNFKARLRCYELLADAYDL